MLPVMVLKESALRYNVELMAALCNRSGISLAPHGKTSMAPQLLQRQLDAGAWAVTAATMHQVRVWRTFGAERVLLANELVEAASAVWVATELERDPSFNFFCLVDSVACVELLENAIDSVRMTRRLDVLVELGVKGGRTGCRTRTQAREVALAVAASKHLSLAGVEAFEGVVNTGGLAADLEEVDRVLKDLRALVLDLDSAGLFSRAGEVLVTAGGSAFLDRVVAELAGPWSVSRPVRLVLRSGCYLTHDAAHYKQVSPFGTRLNQTDPLQEALEIWGVVLSLPEPGLAIIGFGKRDAPHDLELPIPRLSKKTVEAPRALSGAAIVALNDQHAFMKIDAVGRLAVGDLIGCGISHPCTAFDKWRLIPVVDDVYRVVDAVLTFF